MVATGSAIFGGSDAKGFRGVDEAMGGAAIGVGIITGFGGLGCLMGTLATGS